MEFNRCWLSYEPMGLSGKEYHTLAVLCEGTVINSAVKEYTLAMETMAGESPVIVREKTESCVALRQEDSLSVGIDGYEIIKTEYGYEITGQSESGVLYGVFHFLRLVRTGHMDEIPVKNAPEMPLRMMNHWDNMDGSIERGYSGQSFFYRDYKILFD